ncbi:MAG TPA: ABC transporter permease [Trueperaceae bacterium]
MRRFARLIAPEVRGRLLILIVLCLVAAMAEPRFATFSNFINVLRQAAILGVATFGQAVVVLSGSVDISTGALVAFAGVVGAMAAKSAGTVVGLVAGVASGALLGFINGVAVARWRVQPVIVTVGMLTFARGLGYLITNAQPVLGTPPSFMVLGNHFLGPIPYPLLVAVAVLLVGQYILSHRPLGRHVYVVGSNEEAALLSGIPVERVKIFAFTFAGLCAAISGLILASRFNSGQPTVGQFMELEAIAAVVLGGTALGGGRGSLWRTTIGIGIMSVISNGMNLAGISPYVQQMALGALIVATISLDIVRGGRSLAVLTLRRG